MDKVLIDRNLPKQIEERVMTIHSNDRDINKWPKTNEFELKMPDTITNIYSIEIKDIYIPKQMNIFSEYNQNTKLSFNYNNNTYTINISPGTYTGEQLANEIKNKMNLATSTSGFICKYHKIQNKFWFGNHGSSFTLLFSNKETYDCNNNQKMMFNEKQFWGLGSYLGYKKKDYQSSTISTDKQYAFTYDTTTTSATKWLTNNGQYINVDNVGTAKIKGENVLYLEIEKYNTMNELSPFAMNTSSSYNNSYNGKVNTAFAKIVLDDYETCSSRNNTNKTNKIIYNQLVKNIDRLKFKFRYHSGLLIDLADNDMHFTLVFYSVKQSNHHLRLD